MSEQKQRELTIWQRLLYASGEMGVTLSPSIIVGWLLYFYTGQVDEAGNKIYIVGYLAFALVNFLGRMVDSVADPFVGYMSDRYHTRWGRRIPWVVIGAPFLTLFSIILWYPPSEPGAWANVAWLIFGLSGFWFFYTAVVAPYLSLLPEITHSNDERIETSTYMGYFDVLGMIVATALLGFLIYIGMGTPDLVVTHPDEGTITYRLTGEDGEYLDPVTLPMGAESLTVAVADFNQDDIPDVVTANLGGNSISVRLGQGNGEFGELVELPMGQSPFSVAVADFNGDHIYDVVTANALGNDVSMRLGVGDGTFGEVESLPVGDGPSWVTTLDLNKDRLPDMIVANSRSGSVSVLLSTGGGAFDEALELPMGTRISQATAEDLNDDGYPELIAFDEVEQRLAIRLGNPDCTFAYLAHFPIDAPGVSVWPRDLNRDGEQDLVVPAGQGQPVQILFGKGHAMFREAAKLDLGPSPIIVVMNDINDDGAPDLAAANFNNENVSLRVSNRDGTFEDLQLVAMAGPIFDLQVADLDGGGVNLGPIHFSDGYKFAAWVLGIAMMLFFWVSVLNVRERPMDASKQVPFKFWEAFGHCLKNPGFWPYVICVSFFRVAIDILVAMIPFMVVVIMGFTEDIAGMVQGAIVIISLPAFVLVYKWSARVGKKKVFLIGNGIFALCLPLLVTMKHFPIFG
ncbi:MAG: MFS transporter, partial [Candidatus Alcyoniella australis]|nr:MFS transporter [Candidatus Alcyoniella australis]